MPVSAKRPTWEEQMADRLSSLGFRRHFPTLLIDELVKILEEEWEASDHWSSLANPVETERTLHAGRKEGIDYAISLLALAQTQIDKWVGDNVEEG